MVIPQRPSRCTPSNEFTVWGSGYRAFGGSGGGGGGGQGGAGGLRGGAGGGRGGQGRGAAGQGAGKGGGVAFSAPYLKRFRAYTWDPFYPQLDGLYSLILGYVFIIEL